MKCPRCFSAESEVRDSRKYDDYIKRRRVCSECSHRFSTYETVAEDYEDFKSNQQAKIILNKIRGLL